MPTPSITTAGKSDPARLCLLLGGILEVAVPSVRLGLVP